MTHQTATIGDTIYFYFAANDTSGSGIDGSTPVFDVRRAGDAASAIPLLSGAATLLTHANYPAGLHEVAIAATVGNGFAADDTFAVFVTLLADSQNPSGFVGTCTLTPLAKTSELNARTLASASYFDPALDTVANVTTVATLAGHTAQSADHAANISTLLSRIVGTLATGTHNPATAAQIAVLSDWINNGRLDLILDAVLLDTGTTLDAKINDIQGGTFTTATDSLEAIRNRGDAAWVTGAGGASTWDPTEKENIRSALGVTGTKTTATGGQLQTIDTVADGIQADLSNATDGLGALKAGIDGIPTTPMRGTNNVPLNPALDTVYTAARAAKIDEITPARLSELDAATSGKMANQIDLVKAEADKIALVDAGAGVAGSVIEEIENRPVNANTTTPPTVVAIRTEMDSNSNKLAEITAARLSELDGVAGKLVAIVDLIKIEVDKLDAVRGEPGQGTPPVIASSLLKQDYVYKNFRNRKAQTSTEFKLYADNATTVDQKSTVSDDGTTGEKGEIISGP